MSAKARTVTLVAAMLGLVLSSATSAHAVVGFKTGQVAYTSQATCFPAGIIPSYTQPIQGTEPKVGEVTYLSVRVVFILPSAFNCAADFFRVLVTVPPNVAPSGGAPICRRFYTNAQSVEVYDSRTASNCPASISIDPATHQFGFNPKTSGFVHPEKYSLGGTWWFFGYDSVGDLKTYTDVVLQVPVKASQTMTNQPVSYRVCTSGTSCATATVNMTINAAPVPPDTTAPARPGPFTGTPAGPTRSRAATIGFTLGEAGGTVRCRLDSGSWVACTSVVGKAGTHGVSGLPDGVHTVSVRQTDASGNASPVGTTAAWRVDNAVPSAGLSASTTLRRGRLVTFRASASDPSGVRRVTIKVGSAATHVGSSVTVRMPRRGSSVRVIVTATDRAGNTRTLTRYLRLRA